ncbi:MAG: HAD-IIA family hydrolase [Pirellulaceae bacterium]|nr:HAD-IIA family hydrolase [Pirellulaceae bacterium]
MAVNVEDKDDPTAPNDSPATELLARRLKSIRHVALDLDGTIYKDDVVFEGVNDFLASLRSLEIGYTFLTNNSSRSRREYVARLRRLGIACDDENVFTSADATIVYMRKALPDVRRIYLLGTPSLGEQFVEAGYVLGEPDDEPEAVVVGFDTTLEYRRLCQAAYWIAQDKPYLATHPDRICPTGEPTVLVDCGAICAAIEAATGRRPLAVPGKPDRLMLEGILASRGLRPSELAMVGDRLYTDMAMAAASGALGVLVLTGEATAEQAAAMERPPDVVVDDVVAFGRMLREAAA